MLDVLMRRSSGQISGQRFTTLVQRQRMANIELSPIKDFDVISHTGPISAIDLDSCEYRYLLAGSSDGSLYIHDLQNVDSVGCPKYSTKVVVHIGRSHPERHKNSVERVLWYPLDHGIFTTSGMDGELKIWDANELRVADRFAQEKKIYTHDMSKLGSHQLIAVASALNHAHLIDLRSGLSSHELRAHSDSVIVVKWSNKEENVLATGGRDGKVFLWDVRRGKSCLRQLDYNNLRGDGNKDRIKLKRKLPRNDTESRSVSHDGYVNGLEFLESGLELVTFGRDGKLRRWRVADGRNMKAKFPLITNEKKNCQHLCLGADGNLFVPSGTSQIHVCHMTVGNVTKTLVGHYNAVNCVTFNPRTHEMYSGGNDRNILVWDPNKETNRAYQDHIKESGKSDSGTKRSSLANTITVDTWSSDEEDSD